MPTVTFGFDLLASITIYDVLFNKLSSHKVDLYCHNFLIIIDRENMLSSAFKPFSGPTHPFSWYFPTSNLSLAAKCSPFPVTFNILETMQLQY